MRNMQQRWNQQGLCTSPTIHPFQISNFKCKFEFWNLKTPVYHVMNAGMTSTSVTNFTIQSTNLWISNTWATLMKLFNRKTDEIAATNTQQRKRIRCKRVCEIPSVYLILKMQKSFISLKARMDSVGRSMVTYLIKINKNVWKFSHEPNLPWKK